MPLSAYALTTLPKLKRYLGISAATYDDILEECINAATRRIETHCGRNFAARDYAELHHGDGSNRVFVKHAPVNTISRVCQGRRNAVEIECTASDAGAARVSVSTADVLTLVISGGASAGTTTFDLTAASYDTLTELVAAINATSGWLATLRHTVDEAGSHLSADLLPVQGLQCRTPDTAMLELPERALQVVEYDGDQGWIDLAYSVPQRADRFDLPVGRFEPVGTRQILVEYNGGQTTIDDDLDMICREFAADIFRGRGHDASLTSESLGDYSYSLADGVKLAESQRERLRRWAEVI